MKKIILMALSSVIALSAVQYEAYAAAATNTATAQPERKRDKFKKGLKKVVDFFSKSKTAQAVRQAAVSSVKAQATDVENKLSLEAAQTQFSAHLVTLTEACNQANQITPDTTYTNIIKEIDALKAQTADTAFTVQYQQAYATTGRIVAECAKLGNESFKGYANNIQTCFLKILELKLPGVTIATTEPVNQAAATPAATPAA